MPRGGYRPGSGPAKGTKYKKRKSDTESEIVKQVIAEEVKKEQLTPLEFMLKIMNDPNESKADRMRMAQAAAPFVHAKAGEKGKRDEREEAAKKAAGGKFSAGAAPKVVNISAGRR